MTLSVAPHDVAGQFDRLLWRYAWVLVSVGLLVYVALLVAAIAFRRGRHPRPSRRSGNPLAEGVWIALVACLVGVLYYWTYTTEQRVDPASSRPGLRVDVTAAQWAWSFAYPDYHISVRGTAEGTPTLVVPSDTIVQFGLTSRDVVHSFWIPVARFKRYAFPGKTTRFEISFPHTGASSGSCSLFCGWAHDQMRFTIRVVSPDVFRHWLGDQAAARAP